MAGSEKVLVVTSVGLRRRRTGGWRGGGRRDRADLSGTADVDEVGLVGGLPLGASISLPGLVSSVMACDAGGAGGAEGDVAVAAGDEWIGGGELPVFAGDVLQVAGWGR